MIDHIGFEVSDLGRTTAFYDPVFFALGGRRMVDSERAIAYGINAPIVWFTSRGIPAGAGFGHLALHASGKIAVDAAYAAGLANGGAPTSPPSPPGPRPRYGRRYYAAYLTDPDGLRVEFVSR
ncbi:MAG TPA: VOC family protein [Solirubrobacteraceae bacterium]|jgi:catechol 2,3-dioxygenase-like lactoylglutathione lyase family enzyme|nr:VOC family protein [Solirubrobacteraceae bacterium]